MNTPFSIRWPSPAVATMWGIQPPVARPLPRLNPVDRHRRQGTRPWRSEQRRGSTAASLVAMGHVPLGANASLRFDVVRAFMHDLPHQTILEVGCGRGAFASRLAEFGDYLGLEPDPVSYAIAAEAMKRSPRGEVRQAPFENLEPGRAFDLVCAFEVTEHIEDDVNAVKAWVSRLRPGGALLVSVPAFQRRFGPYDELVGHFRRYEPEQLADLLASAGLVDVRTRLWGAPLCYLVEGAHTMLARRRLQAPRQGAASMSDRTASSGRVLNLAAPVRGALTAAALPFRWLQRALPNRGSGLVASGRVPS